MVDKYDALVRDLFKAFEVITADDIDPVLAFFGPDSEFFEWGPNHPPLVGLDAMRKAFSELYTRVSGPSVNIKSVGSVGNTVYVERVDSFLFDGEHQVSLPIAGVGEVAEDGKTFTSWRDYFDPTPLYQLNMEI